MHPTRLRRFTAIGALAPLLLCVQLEGQEGPSPVARSKAPLVTVEALRIEPSDPGPETLCRLYVTLQNRGEQAASLFAFSVDVAGEPLEVYGKELYVAHLAAGSREELRLFNFWTTESRRPLPQDGKLPVEVRLEAASWVQIERREEGEEIWTPVAAVEALPSRAGLTLRLRAKPGADD